MGAALKDSFFNKVTEEANYSRILAAIEANHVDFLCRAEENENDFMIFKLSRITDNVCSLELADGTAFTKAKACLITFSISDEKFFFKAMIYPKPGGLYTFDVSYELFKLQRRDNFRVRLVTGDLKSLVLVKKIAGAIVSKKFPIGDISATGCSFDVGSDVAAKFVREIPVEIEVYLPRNMLLQLAATVKSSRRSPTGQGRRVGVQFKNVNGADRERLVKLVMDMHRTLFAKFK